jgi:hypothetical protein
MLVFRVETPCELLGRHEHFGACVLFRDEDGDKIPEENMKIFTPWETKISHFNSVVPCTRRNIEWLVPFRLPTQTDVRTYLLLHAFYMPSSHSIKFDAGLQISW